jgi:hypothetical protein
MMGIDAKHGRLGKASIAVRNSLAGRLKEMAVWLKQCAIRTVAAIRSSVLDRGIRHSGPG